MGHLGCVSAAPQPFSDVFFPPSIRIMSIYTERVASIKKIERGLDAAGGGKVKDERSICINGCAAAAAPDTGGSTFMAARHLQASATPH